MVCNASSQPLGLRDNGVFSKHQLYKVLSQSRTGCRHIGPQDGREIESLSGHELTKLLHGCCEPFRKVP